MKYHDILGVSPGASKQDIKAAFRKKCLENHPDLCRGDERVRAEHAFKEIAEAYQRLSTGNIGMEGEQLRRAQTWARPPRRWSNGSLAFMLCVPLVLTGAYLSQRYPRLAAEFGRPHGIFQPPVNPFLNDEFLARTRVRGQSGVGTSRSATQDME